MLRTFRILNDSLEPSYEHAILTYDEESEQYAVHIPDSIDCNELPAILSLLAKQGIRELDDKWARRFVSERVVPADRQNIGMIMRELHMKKYSEFPILEYTSGRCCMDDFYLQEVKEL
ncbi:MAG: hypothetical protein NC412_06190 [Roseburia sp.]|nr:hypothetical protein [Roseburia sp.]MCM1277423.1 hypothetical protein [Robinsoniella sp.]